MDTRLSEVGHVTIVRWRFTVCSGLGRIAPAALSSTPDRTIYHPVRASAPLSPARAVGAYNAVVPHTTSANKSERARAHFQPLERVRRVRIPTSIPVYVCTCTRHCPAWAGDFRQVSKVDGWSPRDRKTTTTTRPDPSYFPHPTLDLPLLVYCCDRAQLLRVATNNKSRIFCRNYMYILASIWVLLLQLCKN